MKLTHNTILDLSKVSHTMNEDRVCPNDNFVLQVRRDDDGNTELYCPHCTYWEYEDDELNANAHSPYGQD